MKISKENFEDIYPQTPMQKGMLFHTLYGGSIDEYVEQMVYRFTGNLDPIILREAWEGLIKQYPIFRTSFWWEGLDEFAQIVHKNVKLPWFEKEFLEATEEELENYLKKDRTQNFDLHTAPLMRVTLLKLREDEHILLWTYHHMLLDGWSAPIVARQLLQNYELLSEEKSLPRINSISSYKNYISWLLKQDKKLNEKYWQDELSGFETPTLLGIEKQKGDVKDSEYDAVTLKVPIELTEKVKIFSKQHGLTLSGTIQALWALLLSRYSRSEDVVFGSTVSGRPAELAGIEEQVGLFINTLPVRVKLEKEEAGIEYLKRFHKKFQEIREYGYVPLWEIQNWSGFKGKGLFNHIFVYENYPVVGIKQNNDFLKKNNLLISEAKPIERTNYPLVVGVNEAEGQLSLKLDYAKSHYDREDLQKLLNHYKGLLEVITAHPEEKLKDIDLLTEKEKNQILYVWNNTKQDYWQEKTVPELFEEQVKKTPNNIAVVFEDQQLTYEELNNKSNQLAHYLQKQGVRADMLVAVCLDRSLELIIAFLGILKAGGAYVPLDPEYPLDRLEYMLVDSKAKHIITQEKFKTHLPSLSSARYIVVDEIQRELDQQLKTTPQIFLSPENLAYVIYTSGSTGKPKGTLIPQRAINRLVFNQRYVEIQPTDKIAQVSTANFDAATFEIWAALLLGAQTCILSKDSLLDFNILKSFVKKHSINIIFLTTAFFNQISNTDPEILANFRYVLFGGERVDVNAVKKFLHNKPSQHLLHVYGPTECTTYSSWYEIKDHDGDLNNIPIGAGLSNTTLYVLDQDLNAIPMGVIGELYIGGPGLARGYLNRLDFTAERFIANPFATAEDIKAGNTRLYKTGDLCRWLSEGNVEYVGRIDHQVKIRGFRIELGEIESALSNHDQIREVVVLVREDEPGQKRLVAYYVLKDFTSILTTADLRDYLNKILPDYMIPSAFMALEEMPLTPNGKLDRKGLPAPEYVRVEFTSARNEIEEKLVEIWQKVLHVESVSVLDNFFELGGDSIISIQMISRANEQGMNLKAKDIFQSPTIAELALIVRERSHQELRASEKTGEVPLSAIQHWFFESSYAEPSHWNQSLLLKLPKGVDKENIEAALKAAFQNHPNLFIRYKKEKEEMVQRYDEIVPVEIESFLLTEKDKTTEQEKKANELQSSLNIEEGPLFRIAIFKGHTDDQLRLLMIIHHLVVDGVSWRILLEEIQRGYEQGLRGEEITLIPERSSFKDWEKGLIELTETEIIQNQKNYWLSQPETKALPKDYEGETTQENIATEEVLLSGEETGQLLREVPQAYHTQINDILLTGLVLALRDWTGEKETTIHLEGHGREELIEDVDVSRTVGWFTSLYPIYLSIPNDNLGETIKHVKEQLRAVPLKGIGYGLLRYLGKDKELSEVLKRKDKHQIVFNYLGQLDKEVGEESLFAGVNGSKGREVSPRNHFDEVLSINGSIVEGKLGLGITYSEIQYHSETIQKLRDHYQTRLKELITYCRDENHYGYTPSDFILVKLTQEQLDQHVGRTIEDIYPQTPMQKGMLFHTLYDANRGDYVEQMVYRLSGELNTKLLRQAWEALVQQYPILRTSFWWEGLEEFVQVVHASVELPWLEDEKIDATEEALEEDLRKDREQGFNVRHAPLMRLKLVKLKKNEHLLIWTFHHILLDGWSIPIVVHQLLNKYQLLLENKTLPRIDLMGGYKDYIAWLLKQEKRVSEKYWRERLKGFVAPSLLGIEKSFGKVQVTHYAETALEISAELTKYMKELGKRNGLTLSGILQGIWGLVLSRYSGSDDIVFGSTVSGRPAELPGIEKQVGLFINTVPIRVQQQSKETGIDYIKRFHTIFQEAQEHGYVPLWEIQGWSEFEGNVGLFNHIFIYENYPVGGIKENETFLEKAHLMITGIKTVEQTNYPLVITGSEEKGRVLIKLDYDASYYGGEELQRLLSHYEHLIGEVIRVPEAKVEEINLLTEEEQKQILCTWNNTQREFPKEKTIHELFEDQVRKTPNNLAVVFEDQEITYKELNEQSNQLAHYLQKQGVKADTLVAVCMERSLDLIITLLGVLKAGGAYVPLDPAYPKDRLEYMLEDSKSRFLISQEKFRDHLPNLSSVSTIVLEEIYPILKQESHIPLEINLSPQNLAYVIYTSGSTGKPKGTLIAHQGLTNLINTYQVIFGINPTDKIGQYYSHSFDSFAIDVWPSLSSGASIDIIPSKIRFSAEEIQQFIINQGITVMDVPTAMAHQLLQLDWSLAINLRLLRFGGEKSGAIPQKYYPFDVWNIYGPTENTVDALGICLYDSKTEQFSDNEKLTPAIGKLFYNIRGYMMDDALELCPIDLCGELYLGGAGVARGYLNRPDLTAELFIANPFATEADVKAGNTRLYKTGDLCRWLVDGNIEYVGRIDHQVKIRGFRIELGEIESSLSSHEQIKEAIVLAREDEPGQKRLVAYYVLKDPTLNLTTEALRDYLSQSLPDYMIPSAFMALEAMPLTPNGKLDRKALPIPEGRISEGYRAPSSVLEQRLVEIWEGVLHETSIGIRDNFFALGGHSLLATQVVSRIRTVLEKELPLQELFKRPTIEGIANYLEKESAQSTLSEIKVTPRDQLIPLSYAQQRLWFLDQLEPGNAQYNIPVTLRLEGELNISALEQALNAVIKRHEILRTTFVTKKGEAYQVIAPELTLALNTEECSEDVAKQKLMNAVEIGFDLSKGPLLRVLLFKISPTTHLLFLNLHHSISDGWSMGIMAQEIGQWYESITQHTPIRLKALPIQYADFSVWQREYLSEGQEVYERQLNYWQEELTDSPRLLELPLDHARPVMQSGKGDTIGFELSKELSEGLQELSRKNGATLFMTLLSAFYVLLWRYSGQEDMVVGSPIANRHREEVEGLIGFFVNTLALRAIINPQENFEEFLKKTKQKTLMAYENQDMPFEHLVDHLKVERSLSYSPLFQVMFTLQNIVYQEIKGLSNLHLLEEPTDYHISKFDLSLDMNEGIDKLQGAFEYSSDLFERETVERLIKHFKILLEGIVKDPEGKLGDLALLSNEEEQKILYDWNNTKKDYPKEKMIPELFEEQAERTPNNLAVVFEDQQLTYKELNEKSNQLAHYLQKQGVKADRLIAVYMDRSLDLIIVLLGILKAGGAYVPLDPAYPKDRLEYMLEDSKSQFLITQEKFKNHLPNLSSVSTIVMEEILETLKQEIKTIPQILLSPQNLAYVIYTSGSTGQPKGVEVSHQGLVNLMGVYQDWFKVSASDRVGQYHSYSFDSFGIDVWPALTHGALLSLIPSEARFSAEEVRDFIVAKGITLIDLPTALAKELLRLNWPIDTRLRALKIGGEKILSLDELNYPFDIWNTYGPTEGTIETTGQIIYDSANKRITYPHTSPPIGKPMGNIKAYILNETLALSPYAVGGELYIGGNGLARGYLNCPDLTAERFIANPYATEEDVRAGNTRLYRTGDLCRWLADGNIEYVGRIDHQVKIRGFRIELGEIESILSSHPQIKESIVLAREDEPGQKRLVGYYVLKGKDITLSITELKEYLGKSLPDYMVPSAFMALEEMPLTPNGKLDRKGLPAPEYVRTEFTAVRNEIEEKLAEIWQKVLHVESVSVLDNFFELGGDSIISIQMISRANEQGMNLKAKDIFQSPTIAGLALVVRERSHQQLRKREITGEVPLSAIQSWFFESEYAEPSHWNQSLLLKLPKDVNKENIEAALKASFQNHPNLFMRYRKEKEAMIQSYGSIQEIEISHYKLQEKDKTKEQERITNELQGSLSLEQGPLFRIAIFEGHVDEQLRLLMVIHHLVVDGMSWRILLEEINHSYEQKSRGDEIRLTSELSSFKDWVKGLLELTESELIQNQKDYWLSQPEAKTLPKDKGGEATQESIATEEVFLSEEETEQLLREIPQAYHTQINDILLTSLVLALKDWIGEKETTIHLEGHGREELMEDIDISRTVGWFTSLYPVYLSIPGEDLGETIKQIKEQLRAVPLKGIGYGLLRYLGKDEKLREQLKIKNRGQITFNYLGQINSRGIEGEKEFFEGSDESSGVDIGIKNHLDELLSINGGIVGGQLKLGITYSEKHYESKTIQRLRDYYQSRLREVLAYCLDENHYGYTSSDFTLVKLTQEQIDKHVGKEIEDIYPQTPMQKGMLFHTLYNSSQGEYVEQMVYRLKGTLDIEVFHEAWKELVNQYSIFRTSFWSEEFDEFVQVVHKQVELPWRVEEARGKSDEEIRAYLIKDQIEGFDVKVAPLMRVTLLKLEKNEYILIWTHHHILLDGWSVPIIVRQVLENYKFLLEKSRLTKLPSVSSYRDYISWLLKQDKKISESYWRSKLKGFYSPTFLGIEKQAGDVQNTSYEEITFEVSAELTAQIKEASKKYGLTLSTLIQGLWGILLSRYSGDNDVVFGSTVSGRPAELVGIEEQVGLFINTLPIRLKLKNGNTQIECLKQFHKTFQEVQEHGYVPLWEIQGWSEIEAGIGLFNHIFVYENYPVEGVKESNNFLQKNDLLIDEIKTIGQTNYSLVIIAAEMGGQINIKIDYAQSHYNKKDLLRLLGHYEQLMKEIVKDPDKKVEEINLLTEEERKQILYEWNDTKYEYLREKAIHELFEEQVQKSPNNIAVAFEGQELTYKELNERSNQLAHYLKREGVKADKLVAVCMDRSFDLIITLLGILKAGGAYLPLDPDTPMKRLEIILSQSSPLRVLTQAHLKERLNFLPSVQVVVLDEDETWKGNSVENLKSELHLDNLCYTIYTSGSTGEPKGVPNVHGGLLNRLLWMQSYCELTPEDRVFQKTPYTFDVSVWELFLPLITGARLVFAKPEGHKDPGYIADVIEEQEITVLHFVPSMLQVFLDHTREKNCSSLKRVITSGEALSYGTRTEFLNRFKEVNLTNLYGPTEASIDVTYWDCGRNDYTGFVPIGKGIWNTQLYIQSREYGLVPEAVVGELYLGGVGLARGYLNRPDLTAERFIANPYATEEDVRAGNTRLYRTGDLCRWLSDGNIEYVGRIDHQVKIRGFRIELGEIESLLSNHEQIKEAVVLAREDEPGQKRLVAYYVLKDPSSSLMPAELKEYLGKSLPDYMVPSAFMALEAMPLMPNGKLDRKALPKLISSSYKGISGRIMPRSDIEKSLALIWADVLKINVEDISVNDNFFMLGGHSLALAQLTYKINNIFPQSINLFQLYKTLTIEEQAKSVIAAKSIKLKDDFFHVVQKDGNKPPVFMFHAGGGVALHYYRIGLKDRPIYAISHPYLGTSKEFSSVEEMAEYHLPKIEEIRRSGPCVLFGWSFGGLIALEVARRLSQKHNCKCLVILLDSLSPALWIEDSIVAAGNECEETKTMEFEEVQKNYPNIPDEMIKNILHAMDLRGIESQRLTQKYQPKPYDGCTVLIKCMYEDGKIVDASKQTDQLNGWDEILVNVEVYPIAVEHGKEFRDENVSITNDILQKILDDYENKNK